MTNGPAAPDWAAIIARAKDNGPGELLHELMVYRAWFDAYAGGFKAEHYPPEFLAYLRDLHAPTGKRGRPKTSEWAKAVARRSYETIRQQMEITKRVGGKEGDAKGHEYPVTERPSDLAVAAVADMMNRSEGAALDAIFPERKARQRAKKKPPE